LPEVIEDYLRFNYDKNQKIAMKTSGLLPKIYFKPYGLFKLKLGAG